MTIAENVKRLRADKSWSQTTLAKAAGVSQQLISQIESGANLTTKHLAALANALGVPFDAIDPNFASNLDMAGFEELRSVFIELEDEHKAALLTLARALRSSAPKQS